MTKSILIFLLFVFSFSSFSLENTSSENKSTKCYSGRKFNWEKLKAGYRDRINGNLRKNVIPIFDVESSFGNYQYIYAEVRFPYWLDQIFSFDQNFNEHGVAISALSPEIKKPHLRSLKFPNDPFAYDCVLLEIEDFDYKWFMPVTAAGRLFIDKDDNYLDKILEGVLERDHKIIGEFYFRHYPNNSQKKFLKDSSRFDLEVKLDSAIGNKIFAFSEKYNVPFEIHYEVEDENLVTLEKMLEKYPKANVIWAHFGRVRKPNKTKNYNIEYVKKLIAKYPNLYFDLSCIGFGSNYPDSTNNDSILWDYPNPRFTKEVLGLIKQNPYRFLAALDLGSDRNNFQSVRKKIDNMRMILSQFDVATQKVLAYKAAWKLIFREDI